MNTRSVKINLSPADGSTPREIDAGSDIVTIYAGYEKREIVVLPDVRGFTVHICDGKTRLMDPFVVFEVSDDGSLRLRWNGGEGDFEIGHDELGVVVRPLTEEEVRLRALKREVVWLGRLMGKEEETGLRRILHAIRKSDRKTTLCGMETRMAKGGWSPCLGPTQASTGGDVVCPGCQEVLDGKRGKP